MIQNRVATDVRGVQVGEWTGFTWKRVVTGWKHQNVDDVLMFLL
jgi:hypothetical protein